MKKSVLILAGFVLATVSILFISSGKTSQNPAPPAQDHNSYLSTTMRKLKFLSIGIIIGFGLAIAAVSLVAFKSSTNSPVRADHHAELREVYYPATEPLGPDEMRVVALGTGMPNARPKQAASCWLVELGNGEKFLFDIGSGSAERISAMKIPMDQLDKLFIGHLHSDHVGDFDGLWIGGVVANRMVPLNVWGPSGAEPQWGTKAFIEGQKLSYAWDVDSRYGNVDTRGLAINVTEFDYKIENEIVYEENGVMIRSFPAIHAMDGSVSYTLEWNGLKFAYSSDTYPNTWWAQYAVNCDIAIHECFASPKILIEKQKFPPGTALNVGTQVHTAPAQFGKVMSKIKPRMAVAFHFFNDFDTYPIVYDEVRQTYDGPLALATDYMVFNVTKDDVKVRMAAIDEDIWPLPSSIRPIPADPSKALGFSDFVLGGRDNFVDVLKNYWDDINEEYGTSVPYPPGVK